MDESGENLKSITKQVLKSKSGEFDIESIHSLCMRESGISDLGCVGECFGLERVDLSRNNVTKLYALAGLTNLTFLNLSANRITSLEGLQALDNLVILNIAGNLIGSMDTLRCLSSLEKLSDLRLQDTIRGLSNPVCMNNSYKKDAMKMLSDIKTLDGERVRGKGSQLSELCDELDEMFERHGRLELNDVDQPSASWVKDDFWKPNPSGVDLEDAEEQLKGMLSQCNEAEKKADARLQAISSKLSANDT